MSSAISPADNTPSTSVPKTQDVTHASLVSAEDTLAAPTISLGTVHQISDSLSTDGFVSAFSASTPTSTTAPTPDVASPQSPASSDADGHPHWDDVVAFHNAVLPQSSTPPLPDFDIPITWRPRPSPMELLPEDLWPQYIKEWWQGRFASAWDGFEALPPPPQ
ncbi:hypothetical protein DICSQDRAFT_171984 [Dichomitus squalens LYAD-421 SS1]|uniref:Uncharacterized protein n=1 Tax=Dichomitus squalens (strain LYAD-421) TaxID=732165 RepID=R7SUJ3_DICSQ|nr:uncharacterized protein DICSQDRAFT_171984 [Dichomitus squalens LYAD-421 SS1]EJF59588.1 hypothetical protein DICSQDRAFT_171984 [Dichomitus squalens LYAD-421 SS1]